MDPIKRLLYNASKRMNREYTEQEHQEYISEGYPLIATYVFYFINVIIGELIYNPNEFLMNMFIHLILGAHLFIVLFGGISYILSKIIYSIIKNYRIEIYYSFMFIIFLWAFWIEKMVPGWS